MIIYVYRFFACMKYPVFLPKSNFLTKIKCSERAALDTSLANLGGLHDFYEWQKQREGSLKEFRILDGPPYANGSVHVGHAINKILKDFIVKSCALNGLRVIYQPGWDCHGLPIEMKIKKEDISRNCNVFSIQKKARDIANCSIKSQMNTFQRWCVSADWKNYYSTMSRNYVSKQLQIFAILYKKGLVYRDFRPVYWSPSSKTALAESELEYNHTHKSLSVYFRFQIININLSALDLKTTAKNPIHIYALIWTTTPWTLPLNNAIAYSSNLRYALIQIGENNYRF